MMPRIEAGEHLDAIRSQGIAYGGYAEETRQEMLDALRARAKGEQGDAPAAPTRATPEQLAAMGIGFEIVGAPSATSQGPVSNG